jgi:hypothetical protein
VVAAALVIVLAGCGLVGGDDDASTGPTATPTPTAPAPTASASTAPPSRTAPPSTTTRVRPATVDHAGFESPSGKIVCALDGPADGEGASVRCTAFGATYSVPPRPADCDLEWGPDIGLGTSAGFECAGDTVAQAADVSDRQPWPYATAVTPTSDGHVVRVLPYGKAVRAGDIVCAMSTKGVACDNTVTGAGFRLSKSSYTIHP